MNIILLLYIMCNLIDSHLEDHTKRSSDRGNGSHNVSLPMILKRIKVSQMLRSLCISLLLVPIL